MDFSLLKSTIYASLLDLETEEGINASGKNEVYGCIFGRDSAITILKILKSVSNSNDSLRNKKLLKICRKALLGLMAPQGNTNNIESGEQPGKFIHEYRKKNYDRLLQLEKPWYVYPDGILRNYDAIDSTPLSLIAIYNYWKLTQDREFLLSVLPGVERGLKWIITYGDVDGDYLVEYEFHKERKYGGLVVQSWTDSHESILQKDGTFPCYPIAPVEVQGYVWLALKLWENFFAGEVENYPSKKNFSRKLREFAKKLKNEFNEKFILKDNGLYFAAQALDGEKRQIKTITGNPLILLWATIKTKGVKECIIDEIYILDFVKRGFASDLFDHEAGIRTMSTMSATYNPSEDSYHNGSFWPKLNGLVHEGLLHWGYIKEANMLKDATLKPIIYFNSPVELYIKSSAGKYVEYRNKNGQVGCRYQAWSAATVLELLTQE